jgi:hypothetical protein
MSRLYIDRISLQLHDIPVEIAQAALDGLETEMLRRLQIRGIDAAALSGLSPGIRLPAMAMQMPINAESLRRKIADGLMTLLPSVKTNTPVNDIGGSV